MDNANITMEEYIKLEEEKARRRGKVYNWETATYGKIWCDEDVYDLRSFETEFPAIDLAANEIDLMVYSENVNDCNEWLISPTYLESSKVQEVGKLTDRERQLSNYEVICEDEAKRRNSGAKTKTFEENSYLLPYAVSSKEDTAYQRQAHHTSKRVSSIPNLAYQLFHLERRISSWSSVKDLKLM
ncbi:hypothetical protein Tco_0335536 [Tanacetum coccineum]